MVTLNDWTTNVLWQKLPLVLGLKEKNTKRYTYNTDLTRLDKLFNMSFIPSTIMTQHNEHKIIKQLNESIIKRHYPQTLSQNIDFHFKEK